MVVLFVFMAISLANFSQKVNADWLKKEFKERFISATVLGFPENTPIPFTEDDLRYDKVSWIIPYEANGVCIFKRVQARYSLNEVQENDTLSLDIAEKIMRTIQKSGRHFPDSKTVKFFITKNPSAQLGFKKSIACDGKFYSIIDLPKNAKIASDGNPPTYLTEDGEATILIALRGKGEKTEKLGDVMTLVGIKSSQ